MTIALWHRACNGLSTRLTRNWAPHAVLNKAKAPLVSFSFDDFPHSAANEGAQILDHFAVKGTYFVSGARAGRRVEGLDHFTEDDLVEIAKCGHEIGCHTFSHIRLSKASQSEIETDLARNQEFIKRVLGNCATTSFAYPYGDVSIETKNLLGQRFPVCRGIDGGVNRGRIDFRQLKAVVLTRSLDYSRIARILSTAQASNGWVIFFTHDISEKPSEYGCRPAELATIMREVVYRGMEILPVRSAAEKVLCSESVLGLNLVQANA